MLTLFLVVLIYHHGANGQGCPFGQTPFNGNCYGMSARRDQWFDAESQCEFSSGTLTSVSNSFERSTIQTVVRNSGIPTADYVWIGGSRVDINQPWEWADKSAFTFQEWRPGYPTTDPRANCLAMDSNSGLYMNFACDLSQYYVCRFTQSPPPTVTPQPTTTPFCDLQANSFYVHFHMDWSPYGHLNTTYDTQRAIIHGHQASVNLQIGGPSQFRISAVAKNFGPLATVDYSDDPFGITDALVTFELFTAIYQGGSDVLNVGAALTYLIANQPFIPSTSVPIIVIMANTPVSDIADAIPASNTLKNLPQPYKILVIAMTQAIANGAVQIASDPSAVWVHNGNTNDTIKWVADKSCQFFVNGKKQREMGHH